MSTAEVEAEVKIEVRGISGLFRSTSMLNFKMMFVETLQILTSEIEAEVKIKVRYI